jgi:hypothetical protein
MVPFFMEGIGWGGGRGLDGRRGYFTTPDFDPTRRTAESGGRVRRLAAGGLLEIEKEKHE